jgi:cytochrome c oxidase subunit 3
MAETLTADSGIRPQEQFETLGQQTEAATFAMWMFLATEVLYFGGLLFAYAIMRSLHPDGFAAAGRETYLVIGSINTAILLTSGFTMAWAAHAAETGQRRALVILLAITAALGLAFLILKGTEYVFEYGDHSVPGINFHKDDPQAPVIEMFYFFYFVATGLHGIHLTIGIVVLVVMAVRAWRGAFSPIWHTPIKITGLYWGFVDIVWIFLYPLIYLMGRAGS